MVYIHINIYLHSCMHACARARVCLCATRRWSSCFLEKAAVDGETMADSVTQDSLERKIG